MAEALGWRWEFGVQVIPILLCAAIASAVVPDDIGLVGGQAPRRKGVWDALGEFDFLGSVVLTVATTSAILGLVSASSFPVSPDASGEDGRLMMYAGCVF